MITDLVEQGSLIDRTAELLIPDANWKILYRNGVLDFSEEETQEILQKWSEKLVELNKDKETPECIVACGLCREEAPYEFDKVMEKADGLMYEDKRKIKIARGDDPDQR